MAWIVIAAMGLMLFGASGSVFAQDYPARTVTIVTGGAPGAALDLLSRVVATNLQAKWDKSVIVENKPGAATMLAAGQVAKARPDGYTLLMTASTIVVAVIRTAISPAHEECETSASRSNRTAKMRGRLR